MKKIPTERVIKNIATLLEFNLSYGEAIRLIEIHEELDKRGYRAFDTKTNLKIKKVLNNMGWIIKRLK